jgi:predicted dehydrogenase
MKQVRIGVLGCASIAERSFISAIKSLSDLYKLVAVCSRSKEKAESFAHKFDCESIVGYDNIINRSDIDALYIPLPSGLHKEYILKSLAKRKHVYAEKSIAMNKQDALLMVESAKKHNTALMEGYMFQYHSQHQHVFDLIESGAIGEKRSFYSSFGFPPLPADNFRYDNNTGGGALLDCAGYTVRAAFFVLKQDLSVSGASLYFNDQTNIYGNAFLTGKDGIGAHLAFGFDNFYQCNYKIWGNNGIITLKKAFTPKSDERPILELETNNGITIRELPQDNHFIGSLKEFHNTILTDSKKKHYNDIILQSEALDSILRISLSNINTAR